MANRYWVGGTGSWSDTSHWSTTSGGTGGASVPGSSDSAILDGNSGGGTVTIDVSTVYNLNASAFTGTLAQTTGAKVFAGTSVVIGAGVTTAFTQIVFGQSSVNFSINTNGVNVGGSVTISGVCTLQSALVTSGQIDVGGSLTAIDSTTNVTCGRLVNNGTLVMGSGTTWTCAQDFTNASFGSVNAQTSTLVVGTGITFRGATFYNVRVTGAYAEFFSGGSMTNLSTGATNTSIAFEGGTSYTVGSFTQNCSSWSLGARYPYTTITITTSGTSNIGGGSLNTIAVAGTGRLIVTNGVNAGGNSGNIFWNNNVGAIALF